MDILSNLRTRYIAHKHELMLAGLLFLVATTSFGIGYLASRNNARPPIIIEDCSPLHEGSPP